MGYFDILDDNGAADFRLEYRPNSPVFIDNLKPWAGLEVTTDGTIWAGGGLLYDWEFQENWYFTPSIGAGAYTEGSSDRDLDYPVQFRSQLEVSYEFDNNSRLGASFSHISNAGLGDHNPGTEVLGLYWHVPLNKIF